MAEKEPIFIMIAGPNGSGKSSVIKEVFNSEYMPPSIYINADDITAELLRNRNLNQKNIDKDTLWAINKKAADKADELRQQCIQKKTSFITETVMSTQARVDLIKQAKENGFRTHLIFVTAKVMNNSLEAPVVILEKRKDREILIYPQLPTNPKSKWSLEVLEKIKKEINLSFPKTKKAIRVNPLK